jgi:hypothetical protein
MKTLLKSIAFASLFFLHQFANAQIRFSTDSLIFTNNISGNTDSIGFYVINSQNKPLTVSKTQLFHSVFSVSDTIFTIAASDSILLYVYVIQNTISIIKITCILL